MNRRELLQALEAIAEAAEKVHFWNDSPEPTADLAFDDAMFELGEALDVWRGGFPKDYGLIEALSIRGGS